MKYKKWIVADGNGTVNAKVYAPDGHCCGHKFWMYKCFFETPRALEARLAKATKWADKMIKVCEEGEIS